MAKTYFRRFHGSKNQTDFGKKRRRRTYRTYGESSDSSDEDFVLDKEEEDDDGNESTTEYEVNDSDDEDEAESTESDDSDEESVIRKSINSKSRSNNNRSRGRRGISKKKPRNQSTKRVEISSSDDEDYDPNSMSSTADDEEHLDDDNEGDEEFAKSRRKRKQGKKNRSSVTKKSRKRKKAPVSKTTSKPKKLRPAKNQRGTGRVSQKSAKSTDVEGCESDEDFVIFRKPPVKRQRKSVKSAETGRRTSRKRKLYNTSYSDSSCSDSDYIISEDDDELSYRPHRLDIVRHSRNRQEKKYTCSHNIVLNKYEEASRKKGKEKIDKSKTFMDLSLTKPVCGICLSHEGKAFRGKLDCCDHYFCFVCIMEWAKVESRCPMCKQRFSVISKLPKSGKGLRGTSVKIPVRDQVYQPSEEEIMGFLDPYANIVCLECNEAGDDGLLLLCDLCDSPHHTYCVGLGRVVPEGDWYCQACQTSMPTQSNTEEEVNNFVLDLNDDDDGLTIRELVDGIPVGVVGAESINLDLTLSPPFVSPTHREARTNNLRTIHRRMLRRSTPNPSTGLPDTPRPSVRQTQLFGSPSPVSSAGARTLSGQRILQQRIHVFRDNWNAQERASQQFSPENFAGSNSRIDDRDDAIVRPTINNRSRLFYESTRRVDLDSSKGIENASGNDDIDRAWRLMEESRALAGGNKGINKNLTSGRYCQGSSSANSKDSVLDSIHNARRPRSILGTSSYDAQTRTRNWQGGLDPATINSRGHSGRSMEEISHREIGSNMPSTASVLSRRFCPIASERSESPNKRLINPVSFGFQPGERKTRKVEGAKDQVRTMVKAHVKKMTAGKEIDNLVLKEIARTCTHTVLAACGIDHSSNMVQPFERVSCYHTNQVQSSELMPGCCAHCFDLFVKDLSGNMVRQKLGINV